ncbi:uncharacterized protein [Triticum aestivum]|uniref:uncharacterized protein n=1 Tax=Triticum aestivum TaxID=4565 RepID=UPI001D00585B|nr:uncharacterized protein LOC123076333 [Triticum aestivum]
MAAKQKKKSDVTQTEASRQEEPRIVFPASMIGSKPMVTTAALELKKTRTTEAEARKHKHKDACDDAPSTKKLKTKYSKKAPSPNTTRTTRPLVPLSPTHPQPPPSPSLRSRSAAAPKPTPPSTTLTVDVVLWRRGRADLSALLLATVVASWILFHGASGYTAVSLAADVLLLLLVVLYTWSRAARLLGHLAPSWPSSSSPRSRSTTTTSRWISAGPTTPRPWPGSSSGRGTAARGRRRPAGTGTGGPAPRACRTGSSRPAPTCSSARSGTPPPSAPSPRYQRLTRYSIDISSSHMSPLGWSALSWAIGILLVAPLLTQVAHHLDRGQYQSLILIAVMSFGSFGLLTGFIKTVWVFLFYILFITASIIIVEAVHTRNLGLVIRGLATHDSGKHLVLRRALLLASSASTAPPSAASALPSWLHSCTTCRGALTRSPASGSFPSPMAELKVLAHQKLSRHFLFLKRHMAVLCRRFSMLAQIVVQ